MKKKTRRALLGFAAALVAGVGGTAGALWAGWLSLPALLGSPAEGGPGDEVGDLLESIEGGRRPSGWIVEDAAELRAEPTAQSALRAKLARSTPLVVRDEGAGWAHVKVYGRKLEGWVRSSAIGTSQDATPRPSR